MTFAGQVTQIIPKNLFSNLGDRLIGRPLGLADAPGVAEHVSMQLDGHVDSRFTIDAEHLDAVVGQLHAARIHTLTVTPPSLDALFLRTYGGDATPFDATELGEPAEAVR